MTDKNILAAEMIWQGADYKYTPEQLELIKLHPEYAYTYATNIIKDRWSEAEPYIQQDRYIWRGYKEEFNI